VAVIKCTVARGAAVATITLNPLELSSPSRSLTIISARVQANPRISGLVICVTDTVAVLCAAARQECDNDIAIGLWSEYVEIVI
jgi:phosphopantothenate synthetase